MKVIDLHPEEALDAGRESDVLEHAARCGACKAERTLRQDFAALLSPPQTSADRDAAARIVARVTPRHERHTQEPVAPPRVARPMARWGRAALVATLCLASTGVATATLAGGRPWRWIQDFWVTPAPSGRDHTPPPATAAARVRSVRAAPPAVIDEATELGGAHDEPAPGRAAMEQPPAGPARLAPRHRTREKRVGLDSRRPAHAAESLAAAASAPQTPPPAERSGVDSAALAFDRFTRAHRRGDLTAAEQALEGLARVAAGSREELTARALLAQLFIGRGQGPNARRRALALADSYLAAAPSGPLAEEARLVRAEALVGVGRAAEARAAWRALLHHHPATVHAARARAYLSGSR